MQRIILPKDPQLRAQLEAKLAEYERRGADSPLLPVLRQRAVFKEEALRRLLRDGRLDAPAFLAECQERFGERLETVAFEEAVGVIASYCSGDYDRRVEGGTGLLPPDEAASHRR